MILQSTHIHDQACKRIHIYFGQDDVVGCHPKYLHQIFQKEELSRLATTTEFDYLCMRVNLRSWEISLEIVGATGKVDSTKQLFSPLISRFPSDSIITITIPESKRNGDESPSPTHIRKKSRKLDLTTPEYVVCRPADGHDPILRRCSQQIQPILMLFIDGASSIDHDDRKWRIHLLVDKSSREILAYCSTYDFLLFPSDIRLRLSQFFVVPTFQRRGLGRMLYERIVQEANGDDRVRELTVEDPNDEFADLRLSCDMNIVNGKFNPMARMAAELLGRFRQLSETIFAETCLSVDQAEIEDNHSFVQFRHDLKKYLAKLYSEEIPEDIKERKKILTELFKKELRRYVRLLKINMIE